MIMIAVSTILFVVLATTTGYNSCYTIQDRDTRSYCLAKARRLPSYCNQIQDRDSRALCKTEAGGVREPQREVPPKRILK